jgi:hypothetical protein
MENQRSSCQSTIWRMSSVCHRMKQLRSASPIPAANSMLSPMRDRAD